MSSIETSKRGWPEPYQPTMVIPAQPGPAHHEPAFGDILADEIQADDIPADAAVPAEAVDAESPAAEAVTAAVVAAAAVTAGVVVAEAVADAAPGASAKAVESRGTTGTADLDSSSVDEDAELTTILPVVRRSAEPTDVASAVNGTGAPQSDGHGLGVNGVGVNEAAVPETSVNEPGEAGAPGVEHQPDPAAAGASSSTVASTTGPSASSPATSPTAGSPAAASPATSPTAGSSPPARSSAAAPTAPAGAPAATDGVATQSGRHRVSEPPVLSVVPFLQALSENKGSDLHCKTGAAPRIRIDGRLRKLKARDLTPADTEHMLSEVIRDDLVEDFARRNEADFGFSLAGVGRFRVNAYRARGSVGLVFRRVNAGAASLAQLGVPETIASLSLEPRGLVLVTGPTGSGKTTTLAGMVDHINVNKEVHIVTIEDPIEVLHQDKNSIINQREVGLDTENFAVALRAAMRQDPDVVLVGEMRDAETVGSALAASETGHFVMSTLHTTDAAETITRVIDFFPPHEQKQVRLSLAAALKGIICQRLVPRSDGRGRVVVMEICVNNGRIADAIADPEKTHMITDLIREGGFYGMQTFDQHLVSLFRDRVVSLEDAMHASSNPHDLQVELRAQGLL